MKRSIKIILGIIIPVILLTITYVVLVLTKVLPNPFLDTKDLVCVRENAYGDGRDEVLISFDNEAKIIQYIEKQITTFDTNSEALKHKEMLDSQSSLEGIVVLYDSRDIEVIENEVISSVLFNVDNSNVFFGKTKKEIKQIFEQEYIYECM